MLLKKLAAISLLALFLFNLVGYRMWFYYAQQHSDEQLQASLDNNLYNEQDLIEIKIPLSVPYQVNQKSFERVDGEVNIKGKIYKYVKRKISDGQLILLCIPDQNKMRLQNAKVDFFKNTSDLALNAASKKSDHSKALAFKNFSTEYDQQVADYKMDAFAQCNAFNASSRPDALISVLKLAPDRPPQLI
jgi:hypothetical protein